MLSPLMSRYLLWYLDVLLACCMFAAPPEFTPLSFVLLLRHHLCSQGQTGSVSSYTLLMPHHETYTMPCCLHVSDMCGVFQTTMIMLQCQCPFATVQPQGTVPYNILIYRICPTSPKSLAHLMPCNATPVPLDMQASASSGSLSSAGGQSASGGTDYLKSALDASAAQKETFFARKMEVSTASLEPRVSACPSLHDLSVLVHLASTSNMACSALLHMATA